MYELGQVVEFWVGVEHRVARRLTIIRNGRDLDTGEAVDLSYEAVAWEWGCVCCGTVTVGQAGYKPRLRCQACIDSGVPLPRDRFEAEAEDGLKQPVRKQIKELKPRVSDGWQVGTVLPNGLARVCPLMVTHLPTEDDGNFYFERPDGRVYAYSPGGTLTRRVDREPPKAPRVAKPHNFSGPRPFGKKRRSSRNATTRADIEWQERMEREAAAKAKEGV